MLTDDRRVSNFRSNRRISTVGDRNEPIVLARSVRLPDTMSDDPVGFIQSIQPYAQEWAAIQFREKRIVEGTDVDESFVHFFYIKNDPDLAIAEQRDLIIHEDDMYIVLTSRVIGQHRDDILIRAKYAGRTDGARFDNGALRGPTTTAAVPVAPPDRSGAAFWDQMTEEES